MNHNEKSWVYKYLLVLEMSSDDIMKHIIYSVLFADQVNTRTSSCWNPVGDRVLVVRPWVCAWQVLPMEMQAAFVPTLLHNWTLPPWKYWSLINKQEWGTALI